jgi:hypothetical protein
MTANFSLAISPLSQANQVALCCTVFDKRAMPIDNQNNSQNLFSTEMLFYTFVLKQQ